ncbi:putative protease [Catenibacillus scindens]|uniref:Putative protease n=1 Tax=Catenibacillus scindens TaxID=673271 RepID=A0A7W8M5L3_9FIRM|nr:U32 family peptidase [Catenibacillus scindens]MBB5265044.1 putative protease [Catenibacillus scindens]
MKNIEILAPAGSLEGMTGAFMAGADAVYMGGPAFGARAYADNPDIAGLLSAIDYAHIHGKRLYLTVNTLLKEEELNTKLYPYLAPLYERGLDAVLVQDMGALCRIREWFPDLPIHASTQMTVVSPGHVKSLKALGVKRIVLARELGIEEIRHIKDTFGGEIECFVHGALCYCYSGQCLFSSMLGGRSGNRGRCAQPCRLPYTLYEEKKMLGTKGENYLLSPKDLCTLEHIPMLCEAGIDSFKIEGRMKRPEYAAFVSYLYRKYADIYLKKGRENYAVDPKDLRALEDLYCRGGFSSGYYKQRNGRNMMALARPNHRGSLVGTVSQCQGGNIIFIADTALNAGDVLMAEKAGDKHTVTLNRDYSPGQKVSISFGTAVSPKSKVYRLYNSALMRDIQDRFFSVKNQEKIYVSFTLLKDLPAKIQLECRDCKVEVEGPVAEKAASQPLTREVVSQKLKKTGNTPFYVDSLDIYMDEDAYLPLTAINHLRREGIEALTEAMLKPYLRGTDGAALTISGKIERQSYSRGEKPLRTALVSRLDMVDTLLKYGDFDQIYLESWLMDSPAGEDAVAKIRDAKKKAVIAMPHIFRENSQKLWEGYVETLRKCSPDGYLVRNMESLEFIQGQGLLENSGFILSDSSLYIMNHSARNYYFSLGVIRETLPLELNYSELLKDCYRGGELIVYGYMPLMVTAQCLYKNTVKCIHSPRELSLKDRYGKSFPVRTVCSHCYNLIYNSLPMVLYDMEDKVGRLQPAAVRFNFTFETPEMIRRILENPRANIFKDFTRGHFNRGVE